MEYTIEGFAPGLSRRRRRELERGFYGAQPSLLGRVVTWMSGFSRRAGAGLLGHSWGKAEYAKPAKVYLALTTVVPTSSSTGVTITEATGAVGYARKEVPAASIHEAEEGAPNVIKTTAELVFNNIESGEATVIGWALTDNAETSKGNVVMWGTATSTVISATQTPPTVGAEKLKGELT